MSIPQIALGILLLSVFGTSVSMIVSALLWKERSEANLFLWPIAWAVLLALTTLVSVVEGWFELNITITGILTFATGCIFIFLGLRGNDEQMRWKVVIVAIGLFAIAVAVMPSLIP